MTNPLKRNVGVAFTSLLASTATLVCCVLPAVLVSIGAGAALVGLVSAFPQLVWLSEHKVFVFGFAGLLLAGSGALLWNARRLPCPTEPMAARACMRLRRISAWLYGISLAAFACGALFAFGLPALSRTQAQIISDYVDRRETTACAAEVGGLPLVHPGRHELDRAVIHVTPDVDFESLAFRA